MNNWFTHSATAPFALPNLAAVCCSAPNFTATKLQLFMDVVRKQKLLTNEYMSLIIIKTFSDPHEANICKSHLESEGIPCFLNNEGIIGANPLLSNAVGGYQLQCKEEDAEKALTIIEQK